MISPVPRRSGPVHVLMEDGTWEPGRAIKTQRSDRGFLAALVEYNGVTLWLYREQGRGTKNEWRWAEKGGGL